MPSSVWPFSYISYSFITFPVRPTGYFFLDYSMSSLPFLSCWHQKNNKTLFPKHNTNVAYALCLTNLIPRRTRDWRFKRFQLSSHYISYWKLFWQIRKAYLSYALHAKKCQCRYTINAQRLKLLTHKMCRYYERYCRYELMREAYKTSCVKMRTKEVL